MAKSRQTRVETQPAPTQAARASDVADNECVTLPHAAAGSAFASGRIDARRLTPQAILALQRTAGNAAVNQLLAGTVQPTGSRGSPPLVSTQTAPPRVQRDDDLAGKYTPPEYQQSVFSETFLEKYIHDPKPEQMKDKKRINLSNFWIDKAAKELHTYLVNLGPSESAALIAGHKPFVFETKHDYWVHEEDLLSSSPPSISINRVYARLTLKAQWKADDKESSGGYFQIVDLVSTDLPTTGPGRYKPRRLRNPWKSNSSTSSY